MKRKLVTEEEKIKRKLEELEKLKNELLSKQNKAA